MLPKVTALAEAKFAYHNMEDVAAYSTDELCDYLLDRLGERVVLKLREQKITGLDFISLNDNQLKEGNGR